MDFSEKPQVDISSIASILQRKAQMQQQMDQQGQQQKMQMIQQAVQGATSLVSGLVQASKNKQRDDFVQSLGDSLAAQVPQQNVTLPVAGPVMPDESTRIPTTPQGPVSDLTSQFPDASGTAMNTGPGPGQPLAPLATTQPDFNKMNAVRMAANLDPQAAADAVVKGITPSTAASAWEKQNYVKPDGTMGVAMVNKLTQEVKPVGDLSTGGITPTQRQTQLDIGQQNADTRGENANTNQSRFIAVTGNKFADATDVTKMADYSRLTAAKRLNQFVDQIKDSATGFQMTEASSLLASILQGGGKGTPIAEKLIEQMTPSTVKGSAMKKLEWLTNNPTSVDQGKFLSLMATTGQRESVAAEDNLRQHQVEAVKKYGQKVKQLDPKRYQDVMTSAGLEEANVDPQGRFVRTANTRSLLPNYNDVPHGKGATKKGVDLGSGFSYTVE